jgi:hypothetical protein
MCTTPASAGLAPSEWATYVSNKTLKEIIKNLKPDKNLNDYPLTCRCGETPLSSRMTVPNTLSKKISHL